MKKISLLALSILTLGTIIISCEKDDICAESTPTTPQLIIRFYDANDPEETKPVADMLVYGVDDLDQVVFFNNVFHATTDSIIVPLRTNSDITRLVFHKDLLDITDFQTGNLDVVATSYNREDVYVSRACGYKNIYNDLESNLESDPDNWIVSIEIVNTTVENETSAHVKIYH